MNFTSDWLTDKLPAWREHVVPHMSNVRRAKWLDVGSYEGRSAAWALEHVLDPESTVYCVDVFDDNFPGLKTWGQRGYATRFDENTLELREQGRIVKLQGWSHAVLAALGDFVISSDDPTWLQRSDAVLAEQGTHFHGAYLDADHQEHVVTRDLSLLWPLLLPGAILVCDDYDCPGQPGARIAIDKFLACHPAETHVLYRGFQIIMTKSGDPG